MQTFHFALTIDGFELLSKTAIEVSLILISQSQHIEETKKLSHMVPGLLQTTEDALGSITSVLNAGSVLPRVEKDIVDVARCVQNLEKLALESHEHGSDESDTQRKE